MIETEFHAGVFELWLNTICPVKKDSVRKYKDGRWEWTAKPTATREQLDAASRALANINVAEVLRIYNELVASGVTSV